MAMNSASSRSSHGVKRNGRSPLPSEDHNFLVEGKNQFKKMFREVTREPHSFLVVNYSNPPEKLYMNKNFKPIGPCGKVKGEDCDCA